jgi:hypothetical protein
MGGDIIFAIGLLVGLLFLLLIGLEIAWSVGVIALIGLIFLVDQPIDQVAYTMWDSLNSFALTAMPLFILMGSILGNTGVNEKLFSAIDSPPCPDRPWRQRQLSVKSLTPRWKSGATHRVLPWALLHRGRF